MNIETRKFNLIQDLLKIKDEKTIDTVETLLEGVMYTNKIPKQDSATDLPTPSVKKEHFKKKNYLYTLDELVKMSKKRKGLSHSV